LFNNFDDGKLLTYLIAQLYVRLI